MRKTASLFMLLAMVVPLALAQAVTLNVDHATMANDSKLAIDLHIVRENNKTQDLKRHLDTPIEVPLHPGERLAVKITGTNRLIYTYSINKKEPEKTANFAAIEGFQTVLSAFITKMSAAPVGESTVPKLAKKNKPLLMARHADAAGTADSGQEALLKEKDKDKDESTKNFEEFIGLVGDVLLEIEALNGLAKQVPGIVVASDRDLPAQKTIVNGWLVANRKKALITKYENVSKALTANYKLNIRHEEAIKAKEQGLRDKDGEIQDQLTLLGEALVKVEEGQKLVNAAKAKQEEDILDVKRWEEALAKLEDADDLSVQQSLAQAKENVVTDAGVVKQMEGELLFGNTTLRTAQNTLARKRVEREIVYGVLAPELNALSADARTSNALLSQTTAIYSLLERDKAVFDTLDALLTFVKRVNSADDPETDSVDYSQNNNQPVDMVIGKHADLPSSLTPSRLQGTLQLRLIPYSRFDFRFGSAVVYSFVKAPKYTATEITTAGESMGKFLIGVEEEPYKEFAVGGLLQLVPHKWDADDLSGSIDIGVTADSDNLGFLLGATLTFYRGRAGVGLGAILQKVDVLGPNLKLGGILDSADQLVLDQDYEAGLYLSVNVKTGK